jgi:hypothetical protein
MAVILPADFEGAYPSTQCAAPFRILIWGTPPRADLTSFAVHEYVILNA